MTDARHGLTSAQTVGPFFGPALLRDDVPGSVVAGPETPGRRVRIEGRVIDGACEVVPDAFVELWQADSEGHYAHPADDEGATHDPAFTGFGRCGTDDDGRYWFDTIVPGPVPFGDGHWQAPHLSLTIFARGLLNHLRTRVYFADEPSNADDPFLRLVPAERRGTLLARRVTDGESSVYTFDIVLQGENETVFFDF